MAKRKTTADSETKTASPKKLKWYATAKRNARLADGTFVPAGQRVEISTEYMERLRDTNDQTFTITQA